MTFSWLLKLSTQFYRNFNISRHCPLGIEINQKKGFWDRFIYFGMLCTCCCLSVCLVILSIRSLLSLLKYYFPVNSEQTIWNCRKFCPTIALALAFLYKLLASSIEQKMNISDVMKIVFEIRKLLSISFQIIQYKNHGIFQQ